MRRAHPISTCSLLADSLDSRAANYLATTTVGNVPCKLYVDVLLMRASSNRADQTTLLPKSLSEVFSVVTGIL